MNNICIVLVETSHGGNIGAVARAMKTMALCRLVLIRPNDFPSAECTARACGADDILAKAEVYADLGEAIKDCRLVIGSSVRRRTVAWPELDPCQTAHRLLSEATQGKVALVFGRECSGLSNAELDHCHALACIPSDPQFSSLNVAAAAQVFAYEIRRACLAAVTIISEPRPIAHKAELESMFEHLAVTMKDIGFADPNQSRKLMRRLRRLFYRAQPDHNEINILRGLLSTAQYLARRVPNQSSYHEHGTSGCG